MQLIETAEQLVQALNERPEHVARCLQRLSRFNGQHKVNSVLTWAGYTQIASNPVKSGRDKARHKAKQIAEDLMTNGNGDIADSLHLVRGGSDVRSPGTVESDNTYLGGWSIEGLTSRTQLHLQGSLDEMSAEEADAEYDAAPAIPINNEEIEAIMSKVTGKHEYPN